MLGSGRGGEPIVGGCGVVDGGGDECVKTCGRGGIVGTCDGCGIGANVGSEGVSSVRDRTVASMVVSVEVGVSVGDNGGLGEGGGIVIGGSVGGANIAGGGNVAGDSINFDESRQEYITRGGVYNRYTVLFQHLLK